MCGFCGFTGEVENKEQVIENMMEKIVYRGPDSKGSHVDSDIALGFRRLSIIDLADGTQPIYNEDGTWAGPVGLAMYVELNLCIIHKLEMI